MTKPDPKRVAAAFQSGITPSRSKTAGEVIFRKDRGGDKNEWAWANVNPSKRDFGEGFDFNPRQLKPLAQTLRATLMALGHIVSANSTFLKIKSADVSPDGSLGGRGYVMKVTDIRRQFMNAAEVLSAVSDTLYDEMKAPHWHPEADDGGSREREEVKAIMDEVQDIRANPEEWAREEEAEGQEETDGGADDNSESQPAKTARRRSHR